MKTILAPIDFSEISERVAREAGNLSQMSGAKVVLLHVVTRPIIMSAYGIPANLINTEIEREQQASADQLKKLESIAKEAGAAEVTSTVILGPAIESIINQAEELPADLLVMGTHGHGALLNLLLGSTASGVLKNSPCPVVVIPHPKKKG